MLDTVELDRVRAMPGFEPYIRRVIRVWRAPVSDDVILASSLRDLGRYVSGIWVLFLDATPGGVTLARLSDLLEQTGISSPGRARAMLIYLRFIGFIEPADAAGDGRVRGFRPTNRMISAFRERYHREFEAVGGLDADVATALANIEDLAFFKAVMAGMGELALAGFRLFERNEISLDVISHRYAGMTVLCELLVMADREDQPCPPVGSVKFGMSGLAKACGISRPQVRRILQAGASKGFFELKGEGELVLTPLLAEHIEMLVACAFMMFRWSCSRALTPQMQGAAR